MCALARRREPLPPTPATPTTVDLSAPPAFIDGISGRVLPCIALLEAGETSAPRLVDRVSGRVLPCVALREMDPAENRKAFINKIASLLSSSILPAPAPPVSARRNLKSKLAGVIKPPRQSARLLRLQSNFSSSRRAQAAICVKLGFIKREADFNDDALLAYIDFFREPMPTDNVAKLMQIAGLSSPAQLRLPDEELQAILDELSMRAA